MNPLNIINNYNSVESPIDQYVPTTCYYFPGGGLNTYKTGAWPRLKFRVGGRVIIIKNIEIV